MMLGETLKRLRKSKGMNQEELARLSGVSRNSIVNWETGKREPRTGDMERLSVALDVPLIELLANIKDTQIADNTTDHVTLLPLGLGTGKAMKYAYWGGVLDRAKELADSGDAHEISLVRQLLKRAYDLLSQMPQEQDKAGIDNTAKVSAYNGNHSSYKGNSLTVATA